MTVEGHKSKQFLGVLARGAVRLVAAAALVGVGIALVAGGPLAPVARGLTTRSPDYAVKCVWVIIGLVCLVGARDVLRDK